MTRWLPSPLMSAFLLTLWLLLNQSLSPGHVILGSILAFVGPLAAAPLELPGGGPRHLRAIIRLSCLVLVDITRSNIAVARIILKPGRRRQTSGFMTIPLDLRSPYGLAVLACIITATPGTIWVDFNSANGILIIHVLDLVDENAWLRTIKHRYERLLREIFE